MNDIELHLKNLPHFKADELFKDKLKQKLISETHPLTQRVRWLPYFGLAFTLFILVIGSVVWFQKPSQIQDSQEIAERNLVRELQPEDFESSDSTQFATSNVLLATGFSFHLPEIWSAKVANQSKSHFAARFFLPGLDRSTTYVDAESLADARFIPNPFLVKHKTESRKVNGVTVELTQGKESFRDSIRQYIQAEFTHDGSTLVMTAYAKSREQIEAPFNSLIYSVSKTGQPVSHHSFIRDAHAAEAIAGIDKNDFRKIEVMVEPLKERITAQDRVYKDGYAKFYRFDALKGQRLTTVALEDRSTNPGSFIRSELYDEAGQLIGKQADTRIEFNAPYTGTYYLVVASFGRQVGGFLLKVFDYDQTARQVYVKYTDGSERSVDFRMGDIVMGEREVALIFQFNSPAELAGSQVTYTDKPEEFEQSLGEVTSTLKVFQKPESYYGPWYTIESEIGYEVGARFSKISPSRVFIQPENADFFPTKHQIAVSEVYPKSAYETGKPLGSYGWVTRLFTEETRIVNPHPTPEFSPQPVITIEASPLASGSGNLRL